MEKAQLCDVLRNHLQDFRKHFGQTIKLKQKNGQESPAQNLELGIFVQVLELIAIAAKTKGFLVRMVGWL